MYTGVKDDAEGLLGSWDMSEVTKGGVTRHRCTSMDMYRSAGNSIGIGIGHTGRGQLLRGQYRGRCTTLHSVAHTLPVVAWSDPNVTLKAMVRETSKTLTSEDIYQRVARVQPNTTVQLRNNIMTGDPLTAPPYSRPFYKM